MLLNTGIKIFILVLFCSSFLQGCDKTETTSYKAKSPVSSLTIGLIPEQNIFNQVERYEPIANYLSTKLGIKINLKILPRYGNIIKNFSVTGMDGAFFGSFTYALAHAKLGLEVLARPENMDGTSTYHGVIFVRKDTSIKTAKDMKGKRFAFVDKATTAGYLLPMQYFKTHGIKKYKLYFKETYFAGTHEDVIDDVLNRRADIGAVKNTIFNRLADTDKRIKTELIILETSPEVPENGLAVRKDIDISVKQKLKEALLNMHTDSQGKYILEKFGARRFIETTDKDYAPVFEYAREIGLNLSTYDYMNE
ncbi:MAG: phosphate/phosphite/phosphonate ABC transporter substrate-binding protein [Nitrospirae bacterium]|nr:phosphate/phosphite/phosphonate ABC transporter substrate-binding protein [Nitrospirota bacterium]